MDELKSTVSTRWLSRSRIRSLVVVALVVVVAGSAGVWLLNRHQGGDPGGRLMAKLIPAVRVVPGFETGSVPWISFPCDSCEWPARYAIKIEPRWDSCDGTKGTFGWDPAVIQVGFRRAHSYRALVKLLNSRLVARGWGIGSAPSWSDGGSLVWVHPRTRKPTEVLALDGLAGTSELMVLIEAKPEGRLVSGC
jgi:hypothetical protein